MPKLSKEKEHLVLDNLNLVHYVLHKQLHIQPYSSSYEDYYQEGIIGLILAAIRFEEDRGFKFSTYAFPMIHGSIQRYRRDNEAPIHYPRSVKDVIFKVAKYTSQGFTLTEVEELTGISSKDISDAFICNSITSLDQTVDISDDSSVSVSDTISSSKDDYEDALSQENIIDTITLVSESIDSDLWRGVWEEYIYALLFGEKLNQQYFATKYNMSQAQVSRKLRIYKNEFVKKLTK